MSALLILACSATKRHDAGRLPAIDRYDGPAWRVLRRALRERHEIDDRGRLTVAALSARYGLIRADDPICHYDQRMTRARATELAPDVESALRVRFPGPWSAVFVNVGADYRPALPDPLPWPATLAYGAIGGRLRQLKEWLWIV